MHHAASQFALVAHEASVEGDLLHALKGLSEITEHASSVMLLFGR